MTDGIEARLLEISKILAAGQQMWREQWRRNETFDDRLAGHGERMRELERWRDTLAGKVMIVSGIGAAIGGGVMAVIFQLLVRR